MVLKKQTVEEEKTIEDQTGQTNTYVPNAQTQNATQLVVINQGRTEEKDIPKEKEQESIQTLVNLPTFGSPTKFLHRDH